MSKQQKMEEISQAIKNCKKCPLWKTRNKPVTGEGNIDTKILFIGEAPGRQEDRQGRPFVGRAGKILDELLSSIDLKRQDIYIANILKCRPPSNRNPLPSEIKNCTPHLERQIQIIEPKVIVPMGNFATNFILKKYGFPHDKISKIHGKKFNLNTIDGSLKIVPVYHPAVATYNPNTKRVLKEDFKVLKDIIS